MTSRTIYEDAMWLPWIQKNVLHRPADSFFRTTKCGIFVGDDVRVRSTDLVSEDERGFTACPECFQDTSQPEIGGPCDTHPITEEQWRGE